MSFPDYQHRIADTKRQILVIGMTGRFGRIADLLLERGHAVRVATRDPALPAAARLAARGADITRADLEDTGTLAAAAKDADAVFASGTAHKTGPAGEARHGQNLAEALTLAGAPYLVFVSGAGAGRPTDVPVLEAKRAVEARIRQLRIPAAIIAPVYLMENLFNPWNLAALRAAVLPTPVPPSLRLQQAATADILALSVQALENPRMFAGERIEVASDDPTGEEAAAVLSGCLGRDLAARQLTLARIPAGLATLMAWLERDPLAVDIAALRERFPGIGWHRFGDWAKEQQAHLVMALRGHS